MTQARGPIGETIAPSMHTEMLTAEEIASRNAAARANYLRHNPAFNAANGVVALELPAVEA